jgi:hypothetical protein
MRLFPIVLLGGAVAYYFLRMRTLGTNVKFIVRNIKIKGGSVIQPNIVITLGVQNVTGSEVNIRSIVGSVNYQGKTFADFSNFNQVTIKRNSETLINVTAIPNLMGLVGIVKEIILNKQKGAVIDIQGTANVNSVNAPFNSSFQF